MHLSKQESTKADHGLSEGDLLPLDYQFIHNLLTNIKQQHQR
jgi:hypothetical protein